MSDLDHLLRNIVGRELDELIAVKIFGQERPPLGEHETDHIYQILNGVWFCLPDYYGKGTCLWKPFHFSLIMDKAWLIIEKMEDMGYNPMVEKGRYELDTEWWCASFWKNGERTSGKLACASTPAQAVCWAALDTVEEKTE